MRCSLSDAIIYIINNMWHINNYRLERVHGLQKSLDWWRLDKPWPWSWLSRTMTKSSTCWSETAWLMMANVLLSNWWTKKDVSPGLNSCPNSPRSRTLEPALQSWVMLISKPSSSLTPWRFTSNVPSKSAGMYQCNMEKKSWKFALKWIHF